MPVEAASPFAQMPISPEPIIAQVRRQLADDAPLGRTVETGLLDIVAERAVRELWGSRVKTFVPVLALREARAVLREQRVSIAPSRPETRSSDHPVAMRPIAERPPRDVLPIGQDIVPLDDRDVLSL
jgi:hypothetical protein